MLSICMSVTKKFFHYDNNSSYICTNCPDFLILFFSIIGVVWFFIITNFCKIDDLLMQILLQNDFSCVNLPSTRYVFAYLIFQFIAGIHDIECTQGSQTMYQNMIAQP